MLIVCPFVLIDLLAIVLRPLNERFQFVPKPKKHRATGAIVLQSIENEDAGSSEFIETTTYDNEQAEVNEDADHTNSSEHNIESDPSIDEGSIEMPVDELESGLGEAGSVAGGREGSSDSMPESGYDNEDILSEYISNDSKYAVEDSSSDSANSKPQVLQPRPSPVPQIESAIIQWENSIEQRREEIPSPTEPAAAPVEAPESPQAAPEVAEAPQQELLLEPAPLPEMIRSLPKVRPPKAASVVSCSPNLSEVHVLTESAASSKTSATSPARLAAGAPRTVSPTITQPKSHATSDPKGESENESESMRSSRSSKHASGCPTALSSTGSQPSAASVTKTSELKDMGENPTEATENGTKVEFPDFKQCSMPEWTGPTIDFSESKKCVCGTKQDVFPDWIGPTFYLSKTGKYVSGMEEGSVPQWMGLSIDFSKNYVVE